MNNIQHRFVLIRKLLLIAPLWINFLPINERPFSRKTFNEINSIKKYKLQLYEGDIKTILSGIFISFNVDKRAESEAHAEKCQNHYFHRRRLRRVLEVVFTQSKYKEHGGDKKAVSERARIIYLSRRDGKNCLKAQNYLIFVWRQKNKKNRLLTEKFLII